MRGGPQSERALILAPNGRDASLAAALLAEAGYGSMNCADLSELVHELERGAGVAVVADDALRTSDLSDLSGWVEGQPSWSDFPFVLLTRQGGGPERNPQAVRFSEVLGNVAFIERPFHPTTLISVVRTALRGRRRQYEARARIEDLHEREEQFRIAQQAGGIGTFVWDALTGTVAMSEDFRRLWGVSEEVLPLTELGAMIHQEDQPLVGSLHSEPDDNSLAYTEYRITRPDTGETRWIARRGEIQRDASGRIVRGFGVVYDVSARKEIEAALEASEKQFRAISNSVDQMIWSTRPDGFHDYYNQRWYDYTGVPSGSTDGEAWNGMFHPDDQERAWTAWRHSLATGEPYQIEYRLRHRSGDYRWVLGRAQPVYDAAGRIERWYGTCTDIHDQVETREVLSRYRNHLEDLVKERTAELTRLNERLRAEAESRELAEDQLRQSQKMEAVGQLTGGIAHDFNNLLTGIVGSLDLLQARMSQGRTEGVERYIKGAISSANRAAALTHRLLAFARRQPLDPRPVDANVLITGMEELLRRTMGESVQLEIVRAGGLWPTLCDANQLENAILNLAINGRDAMPAGGKLTVETCNTHLDRAYAAQHPGVESGQYICICVTDTGEGMAPDVIERAFDPFFTTKPIGQGTGLGLSMIYGFARQSEGHAKIYSEVGKGTTVKIYLPRHRGVAAVEEAVTVDQPAQRSQSGETVLVVEDEAIVRDLIVEVLHDLGYNALEAADGPAGLKILNSGRKIDLLVSDVGLPGLNGRQLADQARERRPDLKVLFITGYAENATFGNGHLEPGMQMITKPFPVDALATRIRSMIEGA